MICNMDCFNCIHSDCIRSENTNANEKAAEYRRNNPDKIKAIRRRSYMKNAAQQKAYQRKYYRAHKERLNRLPRDKAKKRMSDIRYYERHREKRLQYARDYRARKKAERQVG